MATSSWLTPALCACSLLLTVGCQLPYLVSQLAGETRLLAGARPLAEVRADPRSSEILCQRLDEVEELLVFAREQGFSVGNAYQTYSVPPEGAPVWIVSACPPDALEPVLWSFPLVGSFPYKGFFRLTIAESEARRLESLGYEVDLRPAIAFSTLGWFADPILPTLIRGDPGERAGVILHELAHRTVFVPGDSRLNESVATSLEHYAVDEWLTSQGLISDLRQHEARIRDRERLRRAVTEVLEELRLVFLRPDRAARMLGREEVLSAFRSTLQETQFESSAYRGEEGRPGLADRTWSLPALLLIDVYGGDGPLLDAIWQRAGCSIPQYLELLKRAAEDENPRGTLEEWAAGDLLETADLGHESTVSERFSPRRTE